MTPLEPAVRLASDFEISTILSWTRTLWGEGLDAPAYEARTRALLRSEWGTARYRFYVATDATGALVAACKVYRFAGRLEGANAEIIGFGAVFTHPDHRTRGHAARLIRGVTAQARGAAAALLFSDIGPAFYARMGFETLGTLRGEAPVLPGLSTLTPWPSNVAPPVPIPRPDTLELGVSAPYRAYLLLRNAPAIWAWRPGGGAIAGHVLLHEDTETLTLNEVSCNPGFALPDLLRDLRRLAGARGRAKVRGWLPAEAALAGFTLSLVTDGVPMLARLDGRFGTPPSHVWEHEHF